MDPLQKPIKPTALPRPNEEGNKATEMINDQLAESLIKMVNFEYNEQHPEQAKRSKIMSSKQVAIIIFVIGLAIVGSLIFKQFDSSSGSNNGNSSESAAQSKQLLHTAETFNKPSSY